MNKDDLDLWSWPRHLRRGRAQVRRRRLRGCACRAQRRQAGRGGPRRSAPRASPPRAFPTDLGNLQAIKQLVSSVHAKLGPLNVLSLETPTPSARATSPPTRPNCRIRSCLRDGPVDCGASGARRPQRAEGRGTGHGRRPLLLRPPRWTPMAVEYGALGLAVSKAAQHKLTSLLSVSLGKEGILRR